MTTPTNVQELENEVIRLLQTNRYDPSILHLLEEFVDCQVSHEFYDPETNLAALKLYQFYPNRYKANTVAKILIKALMNIPSTDFLCSLYLIPERRQVDEPIPVISQLAELLETGRFKQFWTASGSCKDLLNSVPGSLDAIRVFMADVIERTYQKIEIDALSEILNLDQQSVSEFASKKGWSIANGVVTCPSNDENDPRAPAIEEHLSFKQVASKLL